MSLWLLSVSGNGSKSSTSTFDGQIIHRTKWHSIKIWGSVGFGPHIVGTTPRFYPIIIRRVDGSDALITLGRSGLTSINHLCAANYKYLPTSNGCTSSSEILGGIWGRCKKGRSWWTEGIWEDTGSNHTLFLPMDEDFEPGLNYSGTSRKIYRNCKIWSTIDTYIFIFKS